MAIELLKTILASFLGSLGFGLLLHAPKRALLPASAIGAVGYMVYLILLSYAGFSTEMAYLAASTITSIFSQYAARKMKMIALVFLATAIIPLVPGLGLYQCMAQLAAGNNVVALHTGVETMKIVLMIALGMGFGTFMFGASHKKRLCA